MTFSFAACPVMALSRWSALPHRAGAGDCELPLITAWPMGCRHMSTGELMTSLVSARATSSGERGEAVRRADTKVSQREHSEESTLAAATEVGVMRSAVTSLAGHRTSSGPKMEDQLGLEPNMVCKIGDRSDIRTTRPRVTAVSDF